MNQIDHEKLAQIFSNNLGSRLTVELANGMISEVLKLMPKLEESKPEADKETE